MQATQVEVSTAVAASTWTAGSAQSWPELKTASSAVLWAGPSGSWAWWKEATAVSKSAARVAQTIPAGRRVSTFIGTKLAERTKTRQVLTELQAPSQS